MSVSIVRDGASLVASVDDDGPAAPQGVVYGVGLRNTEERLSALYGEAGRMRIGQSALGRLCGKAHHAFCNARADSGARHHIPTSSRMSIRAIVVDDEDLARRGIRTLLRRWPDVEIVAECANGREAVDAIQELSPDLVFLDIEMPGKNGFDVMAECAAVDMPYVIFVTAYVRYALKAFFIHALDYVVKPVDEQRFDAALERARQALQMSRDSLVGRRFAMLAETRADRIHGIMALASGSAAPSRLIGWKRNCTAAVLHVGPENDISAALTDRRVG